jgi:hypothetical protein
MVMLCVPSRSIVLKELIEFRKRIRRSLQLYPRSAHFVRVPPTAGQLGLLGAIRIHGCTPCAVWPDTAELRKIPVELFDRGLNAEPAGQAIHASHDFAQVLVPCTFASNGLPGCPKSHITLFHHFRKGAVCG